MNFEKLKEANETIITSDIKGKAYAEVNQRIKVFRMLYPEGFIHTQIESLDNGVCVMRAEVGYFEPTYVRAENEELKLVANDRVILGTGTAYEKEGSTFINKTSYIENCETSAVGRALAMCGIGIDTSIASKEEVENAKANQNKKEVKVPSLAVLNAKIKAAKLTDEELEKALTHHKVKDIKDLNNNQKIELELALTKKIKEINESEK